MAATVCFDILASCTEPVANKVFSMTVLTNIAKHEPDIKHELKLLIEEQMTYSTAAFKSRAKTVMNNIK